MKRMKQLGYYVLAAFLLTACQSYKKVPYLQDAEVVLYTGRPMAICLTCTCMISGRRLSPVSPAPVTRRSGAGPRRIP